MLTTLSFLLVATLNFAFAADIPINVEIKDQTLTATLQNGYHFNQKAPNAVVIEKQRINPKFPDAHKAEFNVPAATKEGEVSLYVCDDAMTFCKPMYYAFGNDKKITAGKPVKSAVIPVDPGVGIDHHGFLMDDLGMAQTQAKKEHKMIFADVSARWCPGCVRLETETFDTKEFKDATKKFVKLHVDFDRFENSFFKEKYAIHGIPTMMVLNADGDEISRIVDYQPTATIASFLKSVESQPASLAALKKKADAGNHSAVKTLGLRLYFSEYYVQSIPYLEKTKTIELADAKVQAAAQQYKADPKTKEAYVAELKSAIQHEPKSSRSVLWRSMLIETLGAKDPASQEAYKEGVAVSDSLLAHPDKIKDAMKGEPAGEFTGFEKLLIASDRADLIETANPSEAEVIAAKKKVADIGREMKIPLKRAGPSLRYLIFLVSAHEYAEAETLAKALLQQDPNNAEIQRRLIRILNEQKKYAEAIPIGKAALPHSYGQNEVWVAGQLAKSYIGTGDKKAAKELLTTYLARSEMAAMKKDTKDFEEMLKTL